MYKWLVDIYANSDGSFKKTWRFALEFARRVFMLLGDPSYRTLVHGVEIILPVSHKLPIYVVDYPLYDTLPGRLADFLRETDDYLCMVDIGANIGDTILLCSGCSDDSFLAIDANPSFVKYLKINTGKLNNVVRLQAFCGSGMEETARVRIESVGGTARVIRDDGDVVLPHRTLDSIFDEYASFQKVNFLKIDTDGNDIDVLHSGRKSIAQYKPSILFEVDMFGNQNSIEDLYDILGFLADTGYSHGVVYDNFGYLFTILDLETLSDLKYPIFYQSISRFGYYDILILKPEITSEFISREFDFFIKKIPEINMQIVARRVLSR